MLILILIFLIKTFDKIFFKNFLLINDMMYFEFTHIMILTFHKIKNIIKITKCYFLKTSFVFDIFFDIDSIIKHLKFIKYVIFSIFFYSLLTTLLLLIKIIIIFIMRIINAIFILKTILLIFLILSLQILK